jgi:hypothetical protein
MGSGVAQMNESIIHEMERDSHAMIQKEYYDKPLALPLMYGVQIVITKRIKALPLWFPFNAKKTPVIAFLDSGFSTSFKGGNGAALSVKVPNAYPKA